MRAGEVSIESKELQRCVLYYVFSDCIYLLWIFLQNSLTHTPTHTDDTRTHTHNSNSKQFMSYSVLKCLHNVSLIIIQEKIKAYKKKRLL